MLALAKMVNGYTISRYPEVYSEGVHSILYKENIFLHSRKFFNSLVQSLNNVITVTAIFFCLHYNECNMLDGNYVA